MTRFIGFLGLLAGAEGVRVRRHRRGATTKEIHGVPILNFDKAFTGDSLAVAEAVVENWVVVAKEGTSDSQIKSLCAKAGKCKKIGHPQEGGVPFFEIRGTISDLSTVLENSNAQFVEPNPSLQLIGDDDFQSSAEGQLETTSLPNNLKRVGAAEAVTTGQGVNIYVFDTGIRTTHTEFGGRAVPSLDLMSGEVVACDPADLSCAKDGRGHGSHCAAIVAGKTWGPAKDAKLFGVKVLDDNGSGPWSNSIGALDWIATNAAKPAVVSASLGGPGVDSAVGLAVETVVKAGISVVVAAGNSGSSACEYTPAYSPFSIAVGAVNTGSGMAFFSNYGACVDIWAPGWKIKGASHKSNTGTVEKTGTSQAAPLVSAAIALLLETNPTWSPAKLEKSIMDSSKKDTIAKMHDDDNNRFLWIGSDAPAPAPAPAPSPAPSPRPTPVPSRRRWWR